MKMSIVRDQKEMMCSMIFVNNEEQTWKLSYGKMTVCQSMNRL